MKYPIIVLHIILSLSVALSSEAQQESVIFQPISALAETPGGANLLEIIEKVGENTRVSNAKFVQISPTHYLTAVQFKGVLRVKNTFFYANTFGEWALATFVSTASGDVQVSNTSFPNPPFRIVGLASGGSSELGTYTVYLAATARQSTVVRAHRFVNGTFQGEYEAFRGELSVSASHFDRIRSRLILGVSHTNAISSGNTVLAPKPSLGSEHAGIVQISSTAPDRPTYRNVLSGTNAAQIDSLLSLPDGRLVVGALQTKPKEVEEAPTTMVMLLNLSGRVISQVPFASPPRTTSRIVKLTAASGQIRAYVRSGGFEGALDFAPINSKSIYMKVIEQNGVKLHIRFEKIKELNDFITQLTNFKTKYKADVLSIMTRGAINTGEFDTWHRTVAQNLGAPLSPPRKRCVFETSGDPLCSLLGDGADCESHKDCPTLRKYCSTDPLTPGTCTVSGFGESCQLNSDCNKPTTGRRCSFGLCVPTTLHSDVLCTTQTDCRPPRMGCALVSNESDPFAPAVPKCILNGEGGYCTTDASCAGTVKRCHYPAGNDKDGVCMVATSTDTGKRCDSSESCKVDLFDPPGGSSEGEWSSELTNQESGWCVMRKLRIFHSEENEQLIIAWGHSECAGSWLGLFPFLGLTYENGYFFGFERDTTDPEFIEHITGFWMYREVHF